MKRKRNFTTEEAQTATLLVTEGSSLCIRERKWKYPRIVINMCDKEALIPAARVFKTKIIADRKKIIICPPHLFPPTEKDHGIL
jgi:hypothetical protein